MSTVELTPDQLYCATDPNEVGVDSTADLPDIDDTVGQERATAAIRFAIAIQRDGYNLYVAGPTGAGKRTLVDQLIRQNQDPSRTANDWVYVNNFEDPSRPHALTLPAGRACALKNDMNKLVERLLVTVPSTFRGDEYRHQISELQEAYQQRETALFNDLNDQARAHNMIVIRTPNGYTIGPVRDGKLLTPAKFAELPEAEQESAKKVTEELNRALKDIVEKLRDWQEESAERVKDIDEQFIHQIIDPMMAVLKSRYQMYPPVLAYLNSAHQDIAENIWEFMPSDDETGNRPVHKQVQEHPRYQVNVLVDNTDVTGVPTLYEDHPTLQNVIGRVEHASQMGTLVTNFTLIKPGALHRANGGFLILDASKLLSNSFVWDALKRAIRSKEIRMESIDRILSMGSTITLEPEPIPLDLKIILIGDRALYHLLNQLDPEFNLYFKVHADFNDSMDRAHGNTALYARVVASMARREGCRPLSAAGVCRVLDQRVRETGDAEKLSLHMVGLNNLLTEADYWAAQHGSTLIEPEHVEQALAERQQRNNRYQALLSEHTEKNVLTIETSGSRIGQINGLSVLAVGEHAFGRPTRITATARLGNGRLVDIERESDLGGSLHSKGVMILSAFLAHRYAAEKPLALSASLVFEQSYGKVDGDSASMAELMALLSAITEVPIRQHFAMTGSVNQFGEMQAIGGVNDKIEGFYDLCESRGLNGQHGVIIPQANARHLMLKRAVVDASRKGLFHIHTARHVDDVIECLTDLKAGRRLKSGQFSVGSFNRKVSDRLARFADLGRSHGGKKSAKN